MSFIWDFLDVLSISISSLFRNFVFGILIGLTIAIITIIIFRKVYFKKVPKFLKKSSGIFLGIFLFFGGISIGGICGIKIAINRSIRTFVYGTENAVFSQIKTSTGIDVWQPLDLYISAFEDELEDEIHLLEKNVSSSLESNYNNVYKTVCAIQSKVIPIFEIIIEVYNSNRKLINRFVDLEAFEQKPVVATSIRLYQCVNTAAQKSYYNKYSENKNVDFIENLTGIKDSIDEIRDISIGGVIEGFVTALVEKILNAVNTYINPYIQLFSIVLLILVVLCLIPLWIRLRKFKKGKLKIRLKSTRQKVIVTKENLNEIQADLYQRKKKKNGLYSKNNANPNGNNKNNKSSKTLSIISIIVICFISILGVYFSISAVFLALIPAKIAEKKGRYFWNWYLYGIWLFLIAFIHSLFIKKINVQGQILCIEEKSNTSNLENNEDPLEKEMLENTKFSDKEETEVDHEAINKTKELTN